MRDFSGDPPSQVDHRRQNDVQTLNTSFQVIRVVQTYYMDFLRRVKDYGIIQHELPDVSEEEESSDHQGASALVPTRGATAQPPRGQTAEREQKLAR